MTKRLTSMTRICACLLAAMVVASASHGEDEPGDAILGLWDDYEQGATIQVFKCEDLYCGKIVALQNPDVDGKPALDVNNPDKSLRSRPVIGVQVLTGFKYSDNTWAGGSAYSPDRGKIYNATLTLEGDTLSVRVKIGPVHKTVEWIRPEKSPEAPSSEKG